MTTPVARRPLGRLLIAIGGLTAVGLTAAGLLAACTGGTDSASRARNADAAAASVPAIGSAASSVAGPAPAAAGAGSAASSAGSSGTAPKSATGPGTADLPSGPALIKTAAMSLNVSSVAQAATQAGALATGAGGSVARDNRSGSGPEAIADVQLAVPPDRMTATLTGLNRLGDVVSQTSSSTDVTKQVADVGSRVRSARSAIARLQTLYAKANTVGEILSVESTLSSREADLEALEAQQSALTTQTSMASISVHFATRPAPVPAAKAVHHHHGFSAGLRNGWHAFTATAGGIVVVLGALLPFVPVVLVAGAIIWFVRRRRSTTPR
jgi:hypothetical protein